MRAITVERPAGIHRPAGRSRAFIAAAAALAICAGGTFAVRATLRQAVPGRSAATAAIDAGSRSVTLQGIAAIQARLRAVPRDWRAWAALGSAYVQQARTTGDPTYYPKAEQSLRRSLALDGRHNDGAMTGMGALAAARHDFAAALRWGERARAINPYGAFAYGVIGDALIELGRYPEAFAAIQKMVDMRPDAASYARASYAWEIRGDIVDARRALSLALEAASTPGDAAFATYYLGELAWNAGRVGEASSFYRQSLARDPSFVPGLQGVAKVDAATGHLARAISEYQTVVDRLPLPQYVIELGDLYGLAGEAAETAQQIDLLRAQERLFRANGVDVDVEIALFDADHGVDLAAGLAAARREWARRKSVFVADALAWSLYANGRASEALGYSRVALRLGGRNATFYFHLGMIERALGLNEAARRDLRRALAVNPNFSFVWAHRLPAVLRELG